MSISSLSTVTVQVPTDYLGEFHANLAELYHKAVESAYESALTFEEVRDAFLKATVPYRQVLTYLAQRAGERVEWTVMLADLGATGPQLSGSVGGNEKKKGHLHLYEKWTEPGDKTVFRMSVTVGQWVLQAAEAAA